jgi:hypothetical protein
VLLISRTTRNRLTVDLVRRTSVTDPINKQSKVEYVCLGEFDFYVPGSRGVRRAEVSLNTTENRRLIAKITDPVSGHSVTYESADRFTGRPIEMQDTTPPPGLSAEDIAEIEKGPRPTTYWTTKQLHDAIHAAGEIERLAPGGGTTGRVQVLREARARASRTDADPNKACPEVLDRALEALDALHDAGELRQGDFESHRNQLRKIEQGE